MRDARHLNYTRTGIHFAMDTSGVTYGRCSGCKEIKHLRADGTIAEHNFEGAFILKIRIGYGNYY